MGDWIAFVTCAVDVGEWLSSLLLCFTLVTMPPLSKRAVELILTKWLLCSTEFTVVLVISLFISLVVCLSIHH
jgi:hypothetical protein